jgi:hypothetical protein
MTDLIVTLNDQRYLVVDIPTTLTNTTTAKKIEAACKRHEGIYQGFNKLSSGGLFGVDIYNIRVLIPEKNIIAFNNDDL